jgi:GT2 family glycosyltransferase
MCVDNGSGDGLEKCIAKDFPDARFFQMGYNSGFSKASNLGIIHSRGEYIMLLNNDTRITEPIFDQLLDFMSAHPKIGALGARHLDGSGGFQISYGSFPTIFVEIKRKILQYRILRNDPAAGRYLKEFCSREREVDWLSGSCLLLRRDALRQTGLLDESLFMYFEDVDICHRISSKGWSIYYFPMVSLTHYHGKSVKENASKCLFEYRRSQLFYAKKYYGKIGQICIRAFFLLKFLSIGLWSILEYCFFKLFRKGAQAAHARILLSGKVLCMIFLSRVPQPVEPILKE